MSVNLKPSNIISACSLQRVTTSMKKSDLLRARQTEIQKHNLSTFMSDKHKIVQTGCSTCQKHFGTVEQFKRHITEDVLPPLMHKLSREGLTLIALCLAPISFSP